jgi:hypothetical protein
LYGSLLLWTPSFREEFYSQVFDIDHCKDTIKKGLTNNNIIGQIYFDHHKGLIENTAFEVNINMSV